MSLHFMTLIAARLVWDGKLVEILDGIRSKMDDTVGYFAESIQKQLMSREFRKPGLTAEAYLNASRVIQTEMTELYDKVRPEIRLLHEVYFIKDSAAIRR